MQSDSPFRRSSISGTTWAAILLLAVIFASPSLTLAHRAILFAYVKGERVFTESYFSDGKRCKKSMIEVFDSFGDKLLEGKTDENGMFSFKPPKRSDLKIVLTAGMGHRDEYVLPAGELPDVDGGKPVETSRDRGEKTEEGGEKNPPVRRLTRREVEQIREVVEEALDKNLEPVVRLLSKRQKEGISFVQVMGGIGFIFGIMGIILYFRSRR